MRTKWTTILLLLWSFVLPACAPTSPGPNTPVPSEVKPTSSQGSTLPLSTPIGQEIKIAPEIGGWLQANAIPFNTAEPGGNFDDLMPLKKIIGNARIVALGEATHGTHEFFQMKHRMLEFLVKEMGFNTFAIEANWPEANLVNDYIQTGQGDPAQLLAGLHYWTWDTQEVLDMIQWMRTYNQTRGDAPAVSFRGFDMQVPRMAVDNVTRYLSTVDPATRKQADVLFSCIRPYQDAPQYYADAPQATKTRCRKDLQAVYDLLSQHQTDYEARSSHVEFTQALHSARIVQQAEDAFSIGNGNSAARDRYMAENVSWLLDQASPTAKIVVWAHNAHVGADSTSGESMGTYLRKQYGDAMVNFGFSFYSGSFNAITMTDSGQFGAMAVHQVVLPPDNSYEVYFHSIGQPRFFLNVQGIQPGSAATDWLLGPRLFRSVGSVYTEANPESFFQEVALSRMFDVIIYFENTSPSHLLSPQSAASMPQPPDPSQPSNLGFEDGTSHWVLVGTRPQDYQIGTEGNVAHSGAAGGYIRSTAEIVAGFGALLQTFAADQYRGQRLRMSAYIKTNSVSKGAGVLMRVDGANKMLAISNMQDRPIKGTTDWTKYDVVLDIPEDGVDIAFGAWIEETGQISFDDFHFEVAGSDVPVTP